MRERVGSSSSIVKKVSCSNPKFEASCHIYDGPYLSGPPAEINIEALVCGLSPAKFRQAVLVKLAADGERKTALNVFTDTLVAEARA